MRNGSVSSKLDTLSPEKCSQVFHHTTAAISPLSSPTFNGPPPDCFRRQGIESGFVSLMVSNETTAGPALFLQITSKTDASTAAESKSRCNMNAHLDMMRKTPGVECYRRTATSTEPKLICCHSRRVSTLADNRHRNDGRSSASCSFLQAPTAKRGAICRTGRGACSSEALD